MLCVASTEGYFQLVNPSFNRILGYKDDFLLSKSFLEFVHPDDVEKTVQELSNLALGKDAYDFENRYRHADGHYLTITWRSVLDVESGLIYAIARNVSEQVKIKERLLQIEKALYQQTIWAQTDARGVLIEVNNKFCEVSGYSRDELIGKTHKVVNSCTHPPEFFKEMWKTISSGNVWEGVITNRKKSGSLYYVQSILIPIFDHNVRISNYIAIRQDITERINNEAALLKAVDTLNETGSAAKIGGWELDIATGELIWTDETYKILEVEKKVDGRPILPEGLQLFTSDCQAIMEEAVNRAIEFGESYSLEVKALTAKGNVKWVYTNGRAKRNKEGKIVALSGTIQDIDDRKRTELGYNLERQKAIQNAKLASLGELSASVAHEINNPLGIISGNAELIQMSGTSTPEDKLAHRVDTILKSCDRVSHIVQTLKKFTTSSSGRRKENLVLASIVEEAVSLTKPRAKQALIKFKMNITSNAEVFCNEIEIEQVLSLIHI